MSFWGRHPSEVEETGRHAASEHAKRAARGERNVRHGATEFHRLKWWQHVLLWLVVALVATWVALACVNIINAPDVEEETAATVTVPRP
jgi:hypothetical protein